MNHRFESLLVDVILYATMAAVLIFFYVPIFTLIAFSFQEGRFLTLPFEGVSLKWYGELFRSGPALTALWNSTVIAVIAMVLATAIGTMAAIDTVRYRFKGKLAFQGLPDAPCCGSRCSAAGSASTPASSPPSSATSSISRPSPW